MTHFEVTHPALPEVHQVYFPNSLRHDGVADTYADRQGNLYLAPHAGQQHDFGLSDRLATDSYSIGDVVPASNDAWAVRYGARTDLIGLPAVLNSSMPVEGGHLDVFDMLNRTAQTLQRIRKDYGVVPGVEAIDGIALDRMSGRIEFLPPYHAQSWTVEQTMQRLRHNMLLRAARPEEVAMIEQCFSVVLVGVRE